ncbi:MAG: hypothetical protein R2834_03320 [Rhodothermales bacterium]
MCRIVSRLLALVAGTALGFSVVLSMAALPAWTRVVVAAGAVVAAAWAGYRAADMPQERPSAPEKGHP